MSIWNITKQGINMSINLKRGMTNINRLLEGKTLVANMELQLIAQNSTHLEKNLQRDGDLSRDVFC